MSIMHELRIKLIYTENLLKKVRSVHHTSCNLKLPSQAKGKFLYPLKPKLGKKIRAQQFHNNNSISRSKK